MIVLTFATAFSTPLPRYRFLSPSRSSSASCSPVDAPEGTMDRPRTPLVQQTIHFNRRIAPGIQHFSRLDVFEFA